MPEVLNALRAPQVVFLENIASESEHAVRAHPPVGSLAAARAKVRVFEQSNEASANGHDGFVLSVIVEVTLAAHVAGEEEADGHPFALLLATERTPARVYRNQEVVVRAKERQRLLFSSSRRLSPAPPLRRSPAISAAHLVGPLVDNRGSGDSRTALWAKEGGLSLPGEKLWRTSPLFFLLLTLTLPFSPHAPQKERKKKGCHGARASSQLPERRQDLRHGLVRRLGQLQQNTGI